MRFHTEVHDSMYGVDRALSSTNSFDGATDKIVIVTRTGNKPNQATNTFRH